jgi:hypothetical protein
MRTPQLDDGRELTRQSQVGIAREPDPFADRKVLKCGDDVVGVVHAIDC